MLFDSLTHATPDGRWFTTDHDASLSRLLREMDEAGIERAVLVGLAGIIDDGFVAKTVLTHNDRFVGCAGFDPTAWVDLQDVRHEARVRLQNAAFPAVKMHPRLGRFDLGDIRCAIFFDELACWEKPPVIWIDTFLHHDGGYLAVSPIERLQGIAVAWPSLTFVFAHACGVSALALAEAVRGARNAYLDISYTLHRYQRFSVWNDLALLAETFDRRLLWGSDFPEVPIPLARELADKLLINLEANKRENIMGGNLRRIFKM